MNEERKRYIQGMLALGLALYLFELWMNGRLSYYINSRFYPLTFIGILLLLAGAAVSFAGLFPVVQPGQLEGKVQKTPLWVVLIVFPIIATLMGLSVTVILTIYGFVFLLGFMRLPIPENSQTGQIPVKLSGMLLLSIPLILGILVPVKALTAEAVETRGMNFSAPASLSAQPAQAMATTPDDRTILDWIQLFNDTQAYSTHIGEQATVVGFVYHDLRLDNQHFMASRFAITCCVADAFAIGMTIAWPDSQSLPDNTWVKVSGTINQQSIDGVLTPVIIANSVTPIDAPEQPYLYP